MRAIAEGRVEKPNLRDNAADRERKSLDQRPRGHASITRDDERRIPPHPPESGRKRAEHVGKATRFRERQPFRPDDQDVRAARYRGAV